MSTAALLLCLALAIYCDHRVYLAGHDGLFYAHKSPEEKRIQKAIIAKLERDAPLGFLHHDFEEWWELRGRYGRAGGGEYEKTFAFNAWNAAREVTK